MLIDDGPATDRSDAGERIVLPALRRLGVNRVDLILLSHPDLDHVGGTGSVLKAHPEAQVTMSAEYRDSTEMLRRLRDWKLDPSRLVWLGPESQGSFGGLHMRIVCPPLAKDGESNDGSMFVRVGEGHAEAVFSGDAPSPVEARETHNGDWSAEIMKAGHHGSRGSSDSRWLAAVHPSWVIVSCGADNIYGHPHADALRRIAESGAHLARTDREGDITFELRGGHWIRL